MKTGRRGAGKKSGDTLRSTHTASLASFRNAVWKFWEKEGRRTLPWRKTKTPYRIFVSEMMLQQTQVPRVVEKYKEFLKAFPSVRSLAEASLADVLKIWSGLGYNRRAKYLHDAAKMIVAKHGGGVPRDYATLRALPGVGDYTAHAVRVFAFNEPDVLIETNIRAALIHHFYSSVLQKTAIRDSHILPIATKAAKGQDPRTWHSALMDYGAQIKKLHGNPARKSAVYVRQSKFEGSLRQVRGAIMKALAERTPINDLRGRYAGRFDEALAGLARDGLIRKKAREWRI